MKQREPSPNAKAWNTVNPWFLKDQEKTIRAFMAHDYLIKYCRDSVPADSGEYYSCIDLFIKQKNLWQTLADVFEPFTQRQKTIDFLKRFSRDTED